jgi:CRISPR-associated endonuclease/helicase Cas3
VTLDRGDFAAFFAALHDGYEPFAWQERLLDAVLGAGWPDTVDAPTGAGKTAAIDVHVFALALAASTSAPLPPRRLAMIVGRRVLVDDQHTYARSLAARLADRDGPDVLGRVADALRAMRGPGADTAAPLVVARLRGGQPPSRRWTDDPTAAAVLCATPDMWGSRLLFRGYGSAARAWPREAGLLAVDTVAVVDEAHLARQVLCTARRVAELVPVADRAWAGPRPLQVVETTATPTSARARRIGVEEADLGDGSALTPRLRRPKPVTLVPRKDWATIRPRHTVADAFVGEVDRLRRRGGPGTVGCFVNTVARAVAVAAAMRAAGLVTVLLCGQVRPIDIERLDVGHPGVLTPAGNDEVDVIVSTQTLEVGVDLDLAGVVTELAAGSALVQRAGRVNRRGLREDGPVVVIVPDGPIRADARSGPYDAGELTEARGWLTLRAGTPAGLAPWEVRGDPPPPPRQRRRLFQRPELGQVWHWARTSDDLAADPDLDLWLSDDLTAESSVGFVVRRDLPAGADDAIELITHLPPRRHEVFGVPIGTARDALARVDTAVRNVDRTAEPSAVLVRGDAVTRLDWRTEGEVRRPRLRPGDLVVLDSSLALFTAPGGVGDRATPQVVAPPDDDTRRHTADDVLEAPAGLERALRPGEVVLRLDVTDDLATALSPDDDEPPLDQGQVHDVVRQALLARGDAMARRAAGLLADAAAARTTDVIVLRDEVGVPWCVLVIDGRRAVADDDARQQWSPRPEPVHLDGHQQAVAERAVDLARRLGLSDEHTEALRLAGLHHDDGKRDPRFQMRLGARGDAVLAKSGDGAGPVTVTRRRDRSGLPPGWRHEQLSAAHSWGRIPAGVDRELVARLVGTSHGHGRSGFPHTADELLGDHVDPDIKVAATALFDEGDWDELIERTQLRYGAWVCAFLEAVLRAADGQISGEGR